MTSVTNLVRDICTWQHNGDKSVVDAIFKKWVLYFFPYFYMCINCAFASLKWGSAVYKPLVKMKTSWGYVCRYGALDEATKTSLARLNAVAVDIKPCYPLAGEDCQGALAFWLFWTTTTTCKQQQDHAIHLLGGLSRGSFFLISAFGLVINNIDVKPWPLFAGECQMFLCFGKADLVPDTS